MQKWEPQAAAAVVAVAAFELWKVWNTNAPTLSEVRAVERDDIALRQRLLDSDITVGSLALIIGLSMTILMRDATPLVLMLVVFAAVSFFHHWVLAADPR